MHQRLRHLICKRAHITVRLTVAGLQQGHELITTETSTPGTFAISGSGGYVDLYKALAELEKQLPRATWSSLAITQSNDFKKTLLHLVVSTPVEGKKP